MAANVEELAEDRGFMDLYSRQIGAFGLEAMLKLIKMKVLIVGLQGVGVEAAKNTALAGVHTLSLFDPTPTTLRDLGSNFFLTPDDVGRPRAQPCAPRVGELNPNVRVCCVEGTELTEDVVGAHDAVIFTMGDKREWIKWNEFCRNRTKDTVDDRGFPVSKAAPILFISCFLGGAMGSVFVDHGPGYILRDSDGKEPLVKIVAKVEHKTEELEETKPDGSKKTRKYTLVHFLTPDGQPPGSLPDNCLVQFSEVEGMAAGGANINNSGTWRCNHPDGDPVNTVRIGDTSMLSGYTGGGVMTQVKEAESVPFRSLAHCITHPSTTSTGIVQNAGDQGFVMIDMMSMFMEGGKETQMHLGVQAVQDFQLKHEGKLPEANNEEHIAECVKLAHTFNDAMKGFNEHTPGAGMKAVAVDEVDEDIIKKVARHADVSLQPMCTFFGGILSQELVKVSGKFTPIQQWLNYHVFNALPDELPADTAPLNSRYDDIIAVYGKAFHDKLANLKLFMVGCGALGCEYTKNFALLGICTGKEGVLHVTDNDRIEVSNLNRQFLFREDNVGQQKSAAASERAKVMNRDINMVPRQDLVCPETEHIFDDEFWMGLDVVCNALDSMTARFYVDRQCVLYEKPLLESGTMGTGANVDVVVPHKTRSYADGGNADEGGGIPMCTLRNFPHLIDHCIEWARAQFEDLFVQPARQAETFLEDADAFLAKQRKDTLEMDPGGERTSAISNAIPKLRMLKRSLQMGARSPTIQDCTQMAWDVFHKLFRDKIIDLTHKCPADMKTKSGDPFWTGHKKFPQEAVYSTSNEHFTSFMVATTNLFAHMLCVHPAKHPSEKNDPNNRWQKAYRDLGWLNGVVSGFSTPEYTQGAVQMDDDDGGADDGDLGAAEEELQQTLDELKLLAGTKTSGFCPADFEKDDDDNFHIDFITAAANIRAWNYHIPEAPRHKCKMIAGRIIPAIATTTASVTGLVMMELFKVLQGKDIDKLRNGNFDIGSNMYMMFEADPPMSIKTCQKMVMDEYTFVEEEKTIPAYPNPHTKYDKIWVDGGNTIALGELLDKLKEITSLNLCSVGVGKALVWSDVAPAKNREKKVLDILNENAVNLKGKKMTDALAISFVDDDDNEGLVAPVILRLN